MNTARYVHWQDQGMWLGFFQEFPDYITQGESLEELQENLRDFYKDLTIGETTGFAGCPSWRLDHEVNFLPSTS